MESVDPFLILAAAVVIVIVWFQVILPALWRQQDRVTPKPKPPPQPDPPQDGGKMVASRPPIICSVELSPRELFDMIAHGALEKVGRSELKDHNWTVTIDLNQSRTGIKRVVVEVEGTTKKERGHLWLVKE